MRATCVGPWRGAHKFCSPDAVQSETFQLQVRARAALLSPRRARRLTRARAQQTWSSAPPTTLTSRPASCRLPLRWPCRSARCRSARRPSARRAASPRCGAAFRAAQRGAACRFRGLQAMPSSARARCSPRIRRAPLRAAVRNGQMRGARDDQAQICGAAAQLAVQSASCAQLGFPVGMWAALTRAAPRSSPPAARPAATARLLRPARLLRSWRRRRRRPQRPLAGPRRPAARPARRRRLALCNPAVPPACALSWRLWRRTRTALTAAC